MRATHKQMRAARKEISIQRQKTPNKCAASQQIRVARQGMSMERLCVSGPQINARRAQTNTRRTQGVAAPSVELPRKVLSCGAQC